MTELTDNYSVTSSTLLSRWSCLYSPPISLFKKFILEQRWNKFSYTFCLDTENDIPGLDLSNSKWLESGTQIYTYK
jgi:hypothetical protein